MAFPYPVSPSHMTGTERVAAHAARAASSISAYDTNWQSGKPREADTENPLMKVASKPAFSTSPAVSPSYAQGITRISGCRSRCRSHAVRSAPARRGGGMGGVGVVDRARLRAAPSCSALRPLQQPRHSGMRAPHSQISFGSLTARSTGRYS